ncbi:hypothetical protein CMI46_00045 [Candidatus Pacearchaeota archaeon]|nr:hypothetical protein [Candidatus Pacearchaeota archaeon]|tara:strand:- start:2402 stop:2764 length:363 start_codon:yes stop_codon:yes gene_type:complete
MKLSPIGKLCYNFEKQISHNLRYFIGNHEKTVEIFFLSIYFSLQIFLLFLVREIIVAVFIIVFLFFLSLERISVYVWLQVEREKIEKKEISIKNKTNSLRLFHLRNRKKLIRKINKLQKK